MNNLRPDEKATQIRNQQSESTNDLLKKGAKGAVALATGLGGASLGSKIMPFLSQYIPVELAMKGINKVSPKLGEFLRQGQEQGLDIKSGLDFIKKKMEGNEVQEQPKEERNIIQKYSPELHEFISNEVKKGRPVIETAAIAQNDKKFANIIKKLSKDYKTDWSKIVESTYGGIESKTALQDQETQRIQALKQFNQRKSFRDQETDRFNAQYDQKQPQQESARNDLAQAMQQLAQILKG